MGPPVIKDFRNVPYHVVFDLTGRPQAKVPILGALEPLPQPAQAIKEASVDCHKMTKVVLREEEARIPVGFEIGVKPMPVAIDLVFVRINDSGLRVSAKKGGDRSQGIWMKFVILVKKSDL